MSSQPWSPFRALGELAHQPLRLVAFVGGAQHRDRFPPCARCAAASCRAARVGAITALATLEHRARGAVVLLQPHQPRAREVALELEDVRSRRRASRRWTGRPSPTRNVAVPSADVLEEAYCARLVSWYSSTRGTGSAPVFGLPVRVLANSASGCSRRSSKSIALARRRPAQPRRTRAPRWRGTGRGRRRRTAPGCHRVLAREISCRRERARTAWRQAEVVHDAAQQRLAVVLVVDRELAVKPRSVASRAQPGARRCGTSRSTAVGFAPRTCDPVLHLRRGLVGERHRRGCAAPPRRAARSGRRSAP